MLRAQFVYGFGFAVAFVSAGHCDSWVAPEHRESFSESSNFVAVVQPGTKTNKATATVYSVKAETRTFLWATKLSNSVAPGPVFVADDGRHIVTLNDWGSVGYGDNVVAIYDRDGLLSRYSLEEFAPPPQVRTNSLVERLTQKIESLRSGTSISTAMAYHDLFSHSTSSRWWNQDSIQFFWPNTNSAFFCLWLDWDQRWVAWKLSNGKLIEPTKKQSSDWNTEGRQQTLRIIKSGEATAAAYNFLGRLRTKEDRSLIERWLADTQFSAGSSQRSSSDESSVRFTFTASSHKREKADWILARWDGVTSARRSSHDTYVYLGSIEGVINLPAPPQKSDGFLRIQLVPDGTASSSALPEHYLIADLQWSRPTSFKEGRVIDLPLGTNVEFAIYGVTPGSYRVQALWDKAEPYCVSTNRICDPSRGDFVATNFPLVHVRKREISERVTIDCKALLK